MRKSYLSLVWLPQATVIIASQGHSDILVYTSAPVPNCKSFLISKITYSVVIILKDFWNIKLANTMTEENGLLSTDIIDGGCQEAIILREKLVAGEVIKMLKGGKPSNGSLPRFPTDFCRCLPLSLLCCRRSP